MNDHALILAGHGLAALPTGALWWPSERLLCVGDLHLGKAERMARLNGALLPPYETRDTLERLEAEIGRMRPQTVVSLGDSFDDATAADRLENEIVQRLQRLAAGRRWIWVAGNHDPGPVALPGSHHDAYPLGGLVFRHIAQPGAVGEVSGHYHPKARIVLKGQSITRKCFLADRTRIILPAFGAYTGGLRVTDPAFDRLMAPDAVAVLTGRRAVALPRAAMA